MLALLALVVGAALLRFGEVADGIDQLTRQDWRGAEAAALLDATTRSNARRTMELFFAASPEEGAALERKIQDNRVLVDQALSDLDRYVRAPDQRQTLAEIQPLRVAYVRSFSQVATLLRQGERAQAEALLRRETLPAIDRLQAPVRALSRQMSQQVMHESEALRQSLVTERLRVLAAGVAALLVGLGVDELSMSVGDLGPIKALLRRHSLAELQALAQRALDVDSADEVRALGAALRGEDAAEGALA